MTCELEMVLASWAPPGLTADQVCVEAKIKSQEEKELKKRTRSE